MTVFNVSKLKQKSVVSKGTFLGLSLFFLFSLTILLSNCSKGSGGDDENPAGDQAVSDPLPGGGSGGGKTPSTAAAITKANGMKTQAQWTSELTLVLTLPENSSSIAVKAEDHNTTILDISTDPSNGPGYDLVLLGDGSFKLTMLPGDVAFLEKFDPGTNTLQFKSDQSSSHSTGKIVVSIEDFEIMMPLTSSFVTNSAFSSDGGFQGHGSALKGFVTAFTGANGEVVQLNQGPLGILYEPSAGE